MSRAGFVGGYRVVGALLIIAALVHNIAVKWNEPGFQLTNFFSFFTVLSNLFAAVVLLLAARTPVESQLVETLRGAAVVYMVTTGLVYAMLLTNANVQAVPFSNWVLHRIMPLVIALDWLLMPPRSRLALRRTLVWLLFPLAYVTYTLTRGLFADWYPYPFLNPNEPGGYGHVAVMSLMITGLFVALTLVTTWSGKRVSPEPVGVEIGSPAD
ncbi:hypothetical protein SAMN05216266_101619 [Amycolatopsis marina]|uniref:FAR-17a/AIG1-like protein n=1 Tax=Amycolatopsis marina TaxID=490629 RepID=A0A1I0VZ66_9PSEU|nr:Pr6Pr family membrane protein [Amycolatopsis marina]SFA81745.1 hypothetical protein SAMN05216266_101619 [Amycolatopsis marina]